MLLSMGTFGKSDNPPPREGVNLLLRIDYFRFILIYYGPILFLLALGLIIRGTDIFTIDNLKSVKFLGGNMYIIILFWSLFIGYLIYITISALIARGVYLRSDIKSFYKYEKKITDLDNILSVEILRMGLYNCLQIKLKEGTSVVFRLALAKKEDADNVRDIVKTKKFLNNI